MATSSPAVFDGPRSTGGAGDLRAQVAGPDVARGRRLDRWFWLAMALAAAVLVPRSLLIARAHSESFDDPYHLERGLAFLTRSFEGRDLTLNDPPLGEGLVALPMLATNLLEGRDAADARLYDRPGRAEVISARVAVWNAFLFLPLAGLVFQWCRRLYGLPAAWLTLGLVLAEPSFAALLAIPALDVLGVEGIVLGCFLAWRYFSRPTAGRLVAAGAGLGLALMLKHTAVALPPVILAMAGLHWGVRPWLERRGWAEWRGELPGRLRSLALLGMVGMVSIWLLTLCDVSPPVLMAHSLHGLPDAEQEALGPGETRRVALERAMGLTSPWPAGIYLRALRTGIGHGMGGHEGYLFGEKRINGWWYYFPAVASYKVPIGVAVVLLVALFSLRLTPPRWEEWGLVLPALAWAALLMTSKVNIGFRHVLPVYAFLLILAGRSLAPAARGRAGGLGRVLAWGGLGAAALHAASFHPDYLAYMNLARTRPYLAISDSNVDWGQSLKQVREWLDARPAPGRTVSVNHFGPDRRAVKYYLGDRVVALRPDDPAPERGLLLISPVRAVALYESRDAYAGLRSIEPDGVIGRCMLVYDLDKLDARRGRARVASRAGMESPRDHAPGTP